MAIELLIKHVAQGFYGIIILIWVDNMECKAQTFCIFCIIISGEIPSRTVYEDDAYKAIMDVSPASRGHVIILPKTHVANIMKFPMMLRRELWWSQRR